MRTLSALPLAALVALGLAPAPARAENPPYAIQANPPGSVAEGGPARFKPVRSGSGTISQQVCKLEIWLEGNAHGAAWIGTPDPSCSREDAVTLAPGRYRLKLGVTWQAGGSPHSGTAEAPYEVTPRFEMPPYKIAATPPGSVSEGTPARFRPFATGATAISQQVCKLEIWPEGNAHGAVWAGVSDPGCSREEAVNLPAGRYVIKLGIGWQTAAGGASRFATAETPYEVISVEKLQMTKCNFSPAQPMAGRAASVSWEVRNLSTFPLGPFRVSIVVSHEAVDSFTVGSLAAGAAFSRTASFTPQTPGKFRTQCTVDPENAVHEGQEFLKNNSIFNELTVVSADILKPVIVLGTLHLSPIWWNQEYTVCNVDLDTYYKNELTGCAFPCVGGNNGVPSRDFNANAVSADGSGISPGCPGGFVSRVALKPGSAEGPRNHWEDKTYTLKVTASRDGRSADASVQIRVPQYCGLISFPVCVPMEGKGR